MPPKTRRATRPSIILGETDAERLYRLAEQASGVATSSALLGELDRATIRPDHLVPDTVVGMNSTVEFIDETHGEIRTLQLVYPAQADIAADRISVLAPVGVGLIGLKEGQSIEWPDRDGKVRTLRVLKVVRD